MLDHSCQVQRHTLAERGDDLYETPPVAVAALLRHERLPHRLWEPACGHGNIVKVLRAAGHEVIGSDLVDYGDPTHFYRRDFLLERKVPDGCAVHHHESTVQVGRGVRGARARTLSVGDDAAAPRFHGERAAYRDSRGPRTRAHSPVP